MAESSHEADSFVFIREILAVSGVTERCIRKWIAAGKFPRPAGNLNGRNVWLREQIDAWRAAVLAGEYRQERSIGGAGRAESTQGGRR